MGNPCNSARWFDSHRARHKHYPSPFIHPQALVDRDFPVQIAPGPHMQTSDRLSFFQLRCAGKRPCRCDCGSLSSQSGRDSMNSSSGFRTGTDVWMRSSLLLDHTSRSTRETGARASDHIDSHCFWSDPPSRGWGAIRASPSEEHDCHTQIHLPQKVTHPSHCSRRSAP